MARGPRQTCIPVRFLALALPATCAMLVALGGAALAQGASTPPGGAPDAAAESVNPDSRTIPEAIQHAVDVLYDRSFRFATALAAVGLVSMAFIQTVKDALPVRRWFQAWWIRRWLRRRWERAAPSELVRPTESPGWQVAEDDMARLATGGDSRALYDLPIEQLCAQLNAAALIVLDYPWRHGQLLGCLAAGASSEDLSRLVVARQWAEKPRSQQTDEDRRLLTDVVDPRNRVAHQIQRNIDALQIAAGFRWKLILQVTSIALCGVLVVTGLWLFGEPPSFSRLPLYVLTAILSGFLAPVARDLVAALQQLRR